MGKNLQAITRLVGAASYRPAVLRYAVALILPAAALGLTLLVADLDRAPFFPFFTLAILITAIYGGTRPALVALAVCVVLNLSALPPAFSLAIAQRGAIARLLAFVVVGAGLALLMGVLSEIQRRLDFERERLQVTLSSIGDGVIVTDTQGRVTFINAVAERATGWQRDQALYAPLTAIFHIVNETTRCEVENPAYKVLEEGTVQGLANHTILIRRDGTEIPIDDSAAPIRTKSGDIAGVVLVFRDITERKEAETALLRQEKLATVGRLASTIAHEINNPLASVTNLLYLLAASPDLKPELKEYVEMAQGELSRAAHVAKQSLSFYRPLQSNGLIAVEPIVVETLRLYKGRLEAKSIHASSRIDSAAYAMTTPSNLRQVLANLVANAVDAMAPGGKLVVRVAVVRRNGHTMSRITVADTGHGIARDAQRKLFEPFFTTKTNTGTGLGLWLSKQIIEGDGGTIRLRSTKGVGTVFQCQIPGETARSAAEPASH